MSDSKYNYVIAGGSGFYEVAYHDLMELPNVRYFKSYVDGMSSGLMKYLARINFNLKLNKYVSTPLRSVVYPRLFPFAFDKERPLCFIFFNQQFAVINTGYIEYLRRKYPSAKFVLYMQDIVSSLPYYDIEDYKRRFDLVVSYDRNDCEKYGLEYFPTPFSHIPVEELASQEPVDVYFCGKAKNRLDAIMEVYDRCKENGLSYRFYITGVPEDKRIEADDIIYDHPMSYMENLSHVVSCRCIVEIMQQGAVGYTPRLWEAMFYGKHLLTNNDSLTEISKEESGCHIISPQPDFKWINSEAGWSGKRIMDKNPAYLLKLIEKTLG